MEVLVEQDIVFPVGIFLELLRSSIDRTLALGVTEKHARQPAADFLRHFKQRHVLSRAGRTLDFEVVTIEWIHVQQRPYQQKIYRHPNGSPPVGVAPEHASVRFSR